MPELPEVETVKRGLEPVMVGNRIASVDVRRDGLRFPFPENMAARLEGQKITAMTRRAKYILAALESGESLLMHLGMSGRFTIHETSAAAPQTPGAFYHDGAVGAHDHVIFRMEGGALIVYCDPRRFGIMDLFPDKEGQTHPLLAELGVEPLGNSLTAEYLNTAFRGRKTPLKAALLDQKIIAGLGNIYVCETLYRAKLSPRRRAGSITGAKKPPKRLEGLVRAIRDVLDEAIIAGGSSLRDYSQADGELGYFQHSFEVYGREGEPCATTGCGKSVQRIVQSGRSTFFCPACQR
ncbi:MAG: bifunctional DNA-formamidopyrimidine glycosylase/DNA-(apurinic or apyrimidinic site) lyase [Hyphomicrobiales bacterium]